MRGAMKFLLVLFIELSRVVTGHRKVKVICSSFPGFINGEILWLKTMALPKWIALPWRLAPSGRSSQISFKVTDQRWRSFAAIFSHMLCVHPSDGLLLMLKIWFTRAIMASLEILPTCWNFKSGPHESTLCLPVNCRPSTIWRWLSWVVALDFWVERFEGGYSDCFRSQRTCSTSFPWQTCYSDIFCAFICVDLEKQVLWRLGVDP